MTRADLSRKADIPYHRINPWFVRPTAKPSGPDLTTVARVMGVSEDWLVNGGRRRPFDARESLAARIARLDDDGRAQVESFLDYLLERRSTTRSDRKPESDK